MKAGFRITALFVVLVTVALWFFGGMNLGWTKTSVRVEVLDPVTGLMEQRWEDRFQPGLEFVAAGLLIAGVLAAVGAFLPSTKGGRRT